MKLAYAFVAVALLQGCASDGAYLAYLKAHDDAQRAVLEKQRPLIELEGFEDKPIVLKRLAVNMPQQAQMPEQQRPSEWVGVVQAGLGVVGAVGGIVASGRAAVGLATAVGTANQNIAVSGQNAISATAQTALDSQGKVAANGMVMATQLGAQIQAPQANVVTNTATTNTSTSTTTASQGSQVGNGTLVSGTSNGSGTVATNSYNPAPVTTTTTPTTTTMTTTTDNHAVSSGTTTTPTTAATTGSSTACNGFGPVSAACSK